MNRILNTKIINFPLLVNLHHSRRVARIEYNLPQRRKHGKFAWNECPCVIACETSFRFPEQRAYPSFHAKNSLVDSLNNLETLLQCHNKRSAATQACVTANGVKQSQVCVIVNRVKQSQVCVIVNRVKHSQVCVIASEARQSLKKNALFL